VSSRVCESRLVCLWCFEVPWFLLCAREREMFTARQKLETVRYTEGIEGSKSVCSLRKSVQNT